MANIIRRYIAEALYSFPRTRFFVKRVYQVTIFCLWKIKYLFKPIEPNLLLSKAVTDGTYNCFFGYYDKCPWDSRENYLLYLKAPFANRMPKPGESAKICLYDNNTDKTSTLAETKAWCWQQGCMLQWLKGDSGQLIIYNDFQDGKYTSVIRYLDGAIQKTLSLPIYAISKDSRQAVSLNFIGL